MKHTADKTKYISLCGLFAAIMTICSWISIPLGFTPVPVNLATVGVFLAGGLLGPKYGPVSIAVYAFAGAAGVPVFAGFRGGLGVLAGPTGGFVVGYIVAAFLTGLIVSGAHTRSHKHSVSSNAELPPSETESQTETRTAIPRGAAAVVVKYILAMTAGLAACYALGTLWFIISTGTGIGAALVSCVIPFLPGDAVKISGSALLLRRLKRIL